MGWQPAPRYVGSPGGILQIKRMMNKLIFILATAVLLSCGNSGGSPIPISGTETLNRQESATVSADTPFNADSAYQYVARQVGFGPRVPNSESHRACANYLEAELKRHGAKVFVQEATVKAFDDTPLSIKNIIGSFNPDNKERILLFAHWDSRPYADAEPNPKDQQSPIDGADDGASGVGVLLEIARQLGLNSPSVGVDIIFFDAEDYGRPDFVRSYKPDTWCLGSQFWAKNPHVPNYTARFGILLDMVGAKDAVFYKEYTSMRYAARYVEMVWEKARSLGYGKYFINGEGGAITDDHQYVISGRNIPCLDIINYDPETERGFAGHWHTHRDDMSVIDRNTLHAVGHTVLDIVYGQQ